MSLLVMVILQWMISNDCFAVPAQYFSNGVQTNPPANTVQATTGAMSCSGAAFGCNYEVGLVLHSSNNMVFSLQALDEGSSVVSSIKFGVQAGDTKIFTLPARFFVPNGYTLRVLNDTAQMLGATSQSSIIIEAKERN